jgi:hypothetical protein
MTRLLAALTALVLAATDARAQQRAGWAAQETIAEAAAAMPANSDLVLVVENGRELRQTALGGALRDMFGIGGAMEGAGGPWRGLAQQLGYEDLDAFDRLLGHRVVLVARGIANPDTARWALVSRVSADTSRRVRERLEISPRVIGKGQQIFALEQGRYELTLFTPSTRRISRADDRSVALILAPTGRTELFDEVLVALAGAETSTLSGQDVIARAAAMGNTEILLLARLGDRPEENRARPTHVKWGDFMAVSARRIELAGTGWEARVAVRERSRRGAHRASAESTDGAFEAMRSDSLLTVVQRAPLESILGAPLLIDDPLNHLPWPARARELFTGAQAIRVRSDDQGGLAFTLAMQTTDATELARALDDHIAGFLSLIEQQSGEAGATAHAPPAIVPQFGGMVPRAMRIMSIDLAPGNPLAGVSEKGLTAAWQFATNPGGLAGWWTLSLAGEGAAEGRAANATRETTAALIAGENAGQRRKWVWLVAARPRELDALLPPALPDYRGVRSAMQRLDDVVCRLSTTPEGDIEGEFVLRLAAERPDRPAEP